jgi:WD40 repeat protein
MLRRIVLLTAVGLAPLTAIACTNYDHPPQATSIPVDDVPDRGSPLGVGATDPGKPLLKPGKIADIAHRQPGQSLVRLDSVVVPDCRLEVLHKVDVSSQRDGELLVIGTPITDEEAKKLPPDRVKRIKKGDKWQFYRTLREGDPVEAGQLVAQLDDRLAAADLLSKKAAVDAAVAAHDAAVKTTKEAYLRLISRKQSFPGPSTNSGEEVRGAEITYDRTKAEEIKAESDIKKAQAELNQAQVLVEMHEIRTEVSGRIQLRYKHPGENVRAAEPVLQIKDPSLVRVEAMVDLEYLPRLSVNSIVQIEQPTLSGEARTLSPHLSEINSVAVSSDPNRPLVLSASDDGTVKVYDVRAGIDVGVLQHPAGVKVKSVACSPYGVQGNWCLTGGDDGSIRRWDLDKLGSEPVVFHADDGHHQAVGAIAISPDGAVAATGGDDLDLCFWDTAKGKLLWKVPAAHLGQITSLQFTTNSKLLSAGKDNRLRLWQVGVNGVGNPKDFGNRSGDINGQLGATADGKRVLFDQGARLQVLSLPDGSPEAVLQNSGGVGNFNTLALFSPDGRLILTAGGTEGRLQLWRTPAAGDRAIQLRELIPYDHGAVTCAAFAPDGSFLVTATHNRHVMLWTLPSAAQQKPLTARVIFVDQIVDTTARRARVWAVLQNPNGLVIPGTKVSMVIPSTK